MKLIESDIFILDEYGNVAVSSLILSYDCFRALFQKDIPIKGDVNNVKKKLAIMELTYIYHMVNPKSHLAKFENKERHLKAIKTAKLDTLQVSDTTDYNWQPDKIVNICLETYSEIIDENPYSKFITNAKQSLTTGNAIIEFLNEKINDKLIASKNKDRQGERKSIETDIVFMFEAFENIKKIMKDLPETLERVKSLENKASDDSNKTISVIGDKVVSKRADVNRQRKLIKNFRIPV